MKKVSFDPVVKILHMHVWTFAYREARKGEWERNAADRCRFKRRIKEFEPLFAKIRFFSEKKNRSNKIQQDVHLLK